MNKSYDLQWSMYRSTVSKLFKFQVRLKKSLRNGQFHKYSKAKQLDMLSRIEKLKAKLARLSLLLKGAVAAGALVLSTGLLIPATAQLQFDADPDVNPMDHVFSGYQYVEPTFVDLDDDGDLDLVVLQNNAVHYYENEGDETNPDFVKVDDGGALKDVNRTTHTLDIYLHNIDFADLDGDGDYDLITSEMDMDYGTSAYGRSVAMYTNIGTKEQPEFSSEARGELLEMTEGYFFRTTAVDIDADDDYDIVLEDGNLRKVLYYENVGDKAQYNFVEVPAQDNPFEVVQKPGVLGVDFADVDNDGDLDALFCDYAGGFRYYKNSGATPQNPVFEWSDDVTFNNSDFLVDPDKLAKPDFGDIDGDGDYDLAVSFYGHGIVYFENNSIISATKTLEAMQLKVFPNPCTNELKITARESIKKYRLYNSLGNSLMDAYVESKSMDVNIGHLNPGIYQLQLLLSSGELITNRIVKQ